MSVLVWVSKIPFKTGFLGLSLGLGFHPWWSYKNCLEIFVQSYVIVNKIPHRKNCVFGWLVLLCNSSWYCSVLLLMVWFVQSRLNFVLKLFGIDFDAFTLDEIFYPINAFPLLRSSIFRSVLI